MNLPVTDVRQPHNSESFWSDAEGNWYRNCPSCHKALKYSSTRAEQSAKSAHGRNSLCASCSQKTDNIAWGKVSLQTDDNSNVIAIFKTCPSCDLDIPFSSDFTKAIVDKNPNWQCGNCSGRNKVFTLPCGGCSRLIGYNSKKALEKASENARKGITQICIRCRSIKH